MTGRGRLSGSKSRSPKSSPTTPKTTEIYLKTRPIHPHFTTKPQPKPYSSKTK